MTNSAGQAHTGPPSIVVTSSLENLHAIAEAVLQTSARTGAGRARIDLRPPELGHVQIDLRYGADGVRATVTTSSPQAVQALAASSGDLKRALEAQGFTVLGLDVGHQETGEHQSRSDGDPNDSGEPGLAPASYGIDDEDVSNTTIAGARVLAGGTSVDVLALRRLGNEQHTTHHHEARRLPRPRRRASSTTHHWPRSARMTS